jgi:hypothetical protein
MFSGDQYGQKGKRTWSKPVSASALAVALSQPAIAAALPAAIISTGQAFRLRLGFGGAGADNSTFTYQVIAWYKVSAGGDDAFVPVVLAAGTITLSTYVYTVTGMGAVTRRMADTITDTLAKSSQVFSPANNTPGSLELNIRGAAGIEIQTCVGTATNADVFMQECDGEEAALGDVLAGLATAANPGSAVSVSNAAATIAAANAARRSLTITNKSLTAMLTVTLAALTAGGGQSAVSGASAFLLAPAADATHPGGSVTIDGRDYTGAVNGIMSAADATAGNVGVTEA